MTLEPYSIYLVIGRLQKSHAKTGSIISVVDKSTVEIMEPFYLQALLIFLSHGK